MVTVINFIMPSTHHLQFIQNCILLLMFYLKSQEAWNYILRDPLYKRGLEHKLLSEQTLKLIQQFIQCLFNILPNR